MRQLSKKVTQENVDEACAKLETAVYDALKDFSDETLLFCENITFGNIAHNSLNGRDAVVCTDIHVGIEKGYKELLDQELPEFNRAVAVELLEMANNLFVGKRFVLAFQKQCGEVILHTGSESNSQSTSCIIVGKFKEHPDGWAESRVWQFNERTDD